MRFSTSKQLHIFDHLKAHLGYKSCPRTLGTEDLVQCIWRDLNPRSRGWESSTLTTRPSAPPLANICNISFFSCSTAMEISYRTAYAYDQRTTLHSHPNNPKHVENPQRVTVPYEMLSGILLQCLKVEER